jgi:hypothetical protein
MLTAAWAQSGGTFTWTNSMTIARANHTATLLANGKVLVAGGYSGSEALASAELWDPDTGLFAPTGDMTTARVGAGAVLLPNGKVLIIGSASAELYDPSTGTFTATGNPAVPNFFLGNGSAGAVLLANGNVLYGNQLYDSTKGTFSLSANTFWSNIATLLADGSVLLANNYSAALYDPASDSTRATGAPDPNLLYEEAIAGAPLPNGKVLVAGGISEETDLFSAGAELYDPLTATFTRTGNMALGRAYFTATPLGGGTILIDGSSGVDVALTAELYDPVAGAFSRTGSPMVPRIGYQTATLLRDGRVLIVGGYAAITSASSPPAAAPTVTAELYKPSAPVAGPFLFTLSDDGLGQGAIWDAATGQVASADHPAIAGEALSMYTNSLVEGGVVPPQVSVGGRVAEVLCFGDAPGYPGYFQVNFRMPDGVSPGAAVPVRLTYLGRPSNEVTIAVQ